MKTVIAITMMHQEIKGIFSAAIIKETKELIIICCLEPLSLSGSSCNVKTEELS